MHIKFLARGTGSARAAADYLLGARDATGQLREGVEVLQGDPHQGGRGGRRAGVRAQVHVGRDRLGTGRHSDRRADRRGSWMPLNRRPGRGSSRTATPGRPWCTGSAAAAFTCMSSPRGATWRPAGASTSRRRAGRRHSTRSATPSTPNTAGAGRMTRRGRGCSNPGTAPTSRRRTCVPASRSSPPPAT